MKVYFQAGDCIKALPCLLFILQMGIFGSSAFANEAVIAGCVVTKTKVDARVSAKEKTLVSIPENKTLVFVGRNKSGTFYQIRFENQLLWVPTKTVRHVSLDECKPAKEVIRAEQKLKLSFFFGSFVGSDTKSLKNLIVNVPNSSSVAALPNPIVTGIEKGSGYEVGACGRIPVIRQASISACAGYLRESFVIVGRPNPAPPSDTVSLDSLSTTKTKYEFQAFTGELGAQYGFELSPKHLLNLGLGLHTAYYIGDEKFFEYRTGTVFKAESTLVPFGPKGFVLKPVFQIGYDYRFLSGGFFQSAGLKLEARSTGDLGLKLNFGF